MGDTMTLAQMVGLRRGGPSSLSDSALLLIDVQRTYTTGMMRLRGIEAALTEAHRVLERAREAGTPVFHIVHDAGPGTPFDYGSELGRIVPEFEPMPGEAVVVKPAPNSFAKTDLQGRLSRLGVHSLIVAGFMTHMCINSTVRAAFDLGYRTTVVARGTATRTVPTADGGWVEAEQLQASSLASLGDIFATVVPRAGDLVA